MEERIMQISIERLRVHPQNQATSKLSFQIVQRLMESMQVVGFLADHPILVMPDPEKPDFFLILDGRHRYFAAQGLGMKEMLILVSSGMSQSEQMTAITVTNTLANAVHRQLFKGKRVINAYRLSEINPQHSESVWSLAKVNKSDWYKAKRLLDKAVQDAKKAMPQASVAEIIDRMILDPKFSPRIHELYHRESAWQEVFGGVRDSTEQRSAFTSPETLPMAIEALSNYLEHRLQSEKLILKDTDVKSLLLLAKSGKKDSRKAKVILRQLCDAVAAVLRHDMELGGPTPGALL